MAQKVTVFIDEKNSKETLQTAFHILANYVKSNQQFREYHGSRLKTTLDYWEAKAVEFLKNPLIKIEQV